MPAIRCPTWAPEWSLGRSSWRFRVIAEGNDAVGAGLSLIEALAVLEFAREHGDRHLAIVDDSTGVIVDEEMARKCVAAWA